MPKSFWDAQTPIAIAHRGGDGAGYDKRNTLAAFRAAQKLGYEYLETDVVCTQDGKVIVSHGGLTGITARLRGTHSYNLLQGMTYVRIKSELKVGGETISLLEDVLKKFPTAKFFIDPKTDETVEPLAGLLIRLGVLDRVCIGSFRYERVLKMHSLLGDKAHVGVIMGRNNWFRLLPRIKTGRLKHVQAVYMHHSFVSRPMLGLLHAKGFKALIWTCNSKLSIRHAIKCGADGIMSDRINLLKEILETTK
jgi:glycerophosphoryl diester phosphodiesterase